MRLGRRTVQPHLLAILIPSLLAGQGRTNAATCGLTASTPVTHNAIDGIPKGAIPSRTGCFILVATARPSGQARGEIVVFSRRANRLQEVRRLALNAIPTGIAATPDGSLLAVTTARTIVLFDLPGVTAGLDKVEVGSVATGDVQGVEAPTFTHDGHFLFVTSPSARAVLMVDLQSARNAADRVMPTPSLIPIGSAVVSIAVSGDDRYLYAVSPIAAHTLGWPRTCSPLAQQRPQGVLNHPSQGIPNHPPQRIPNHPYGVLFVIDVHAATSDPMHSVVAGVAAGCNPVRVATPSNAPIVYVTARGDSSLFAFDQARLIEDSSRARTGSYRIRGNTIGLAVGDDGRTVVVSHSVQLGPGEISHALSIFDTSKLPREGQSALLRTINLGEDQSDVRVDTDRSALIMTNPRARTVDVIYFDRSPLKVRQR